MFDLSLRVCLIVCKCYKKHCRGLPMDRSPIHGVLPGVFKQDSRAYSRILLKSRKSNARICSQMCLLLIRFNKKTGLCNLLYAECFIC